MTQTQKADIKIALAFGFAIVAASFVAGVFDGLDRAMDKQERLNRLSVYCQQYGALDKLCNSLKE
jgi:hypothetical protein